MMCDDILVHDAVVDGVRDEFRHLSTDLLNAREPVGTQTGKVAAGAGEFAAPLADGVDSFLLSWQAALAATSEAAGNIAANVGGFAIDLQAVDRA
jgi:hypothetical protein